MPGMLGPGCATFAGTGEPFRAGGFGYGPLDEPVRLIVEDRLGLLLPECDRPGPHGRVGEREDLRREERPILGPAYRHRGYRYAARHLHDREQRVEPACEWRRDWHADHGQKRVCGDLTS